jgi:hypothetical protein
MKGTDMKTWTRAVLLALVAAGLLGCEASTDRRDSGGVILTVSHFDGLPIAFSVNNGGGFLQVETIDIRNITKNPNITGTDLMDVELRTYQVVYRRLDSGHTTPPTMTRRIFGNVPHNGTDTINNLPVLDVEQLDSRPLSDLLFENGGFDRDTGNNVIPIELQLTFFGKTLSGDEVATNTVAWTVQFTP